MTETILILVGIIVVFIIALIIANKKSNSSDKTDTYDIPSINIPKTIEQPINIDTPILTNHASMRMQERLGVIGHQQTELMNNAFQYGRTADRTNGDLRVKLETAEMNYDEETVAKFYKNSIFIFTAEDNILKTVYPFDNNKYWN